MAVELSFDLSGRSPNDQGTAGSVGLWAGTVADAAEPCLVIDADGVVVAVSAGCGELLSLDVENAVDRPLVGEVLRFCDFNAIAGELPSWEVKKLPPLLAISAGGLARGLVRVRVDGGFRTVDAISVPLRGADRVSGSLTFFAPVPL